MTLFRPIPVLAAVTLIAAGAGAAAYVAAPERFARTPPPSPAPTAVPQAPMDPLAGLPESLAALLAQPAPDAPSPFLRIATVNAEAFCKGLPNVGLTGPVFYGSEPPRQGWSCVTDVVKPVPGDEASVSSLFLAARSGRNDRLSSIRMKLNLIDPASAPNVQALARRALDGVFGAFGWRLPEPVGEALARLQEKSVTDFGIVYDLRKEYGDSGRYNLLIAFPEPIGPDRDRFAPTRR